MTRFLLLSACLFPISASAAEFIIDDVDVSATVLPYLNEEFSGTNYDLDGYLFGDSSAWAEGTAVGDGGSAFNSPSAFTSTSPSSITVLAGTGSGGWGADGTPGTGEGTGYVIAASHATVVFEVSSSAVVTIHKEDNVYGEWTAEPAPAFIAGNSGLFTTDEDEEVDAFSSAWTEVDGDEISTGLLELEDSNQPSDESFLAMPGVIYTITVISNWSGGDPEMPQSAGSLEYYGSYFHSDSTFVLTFAP